MFAWVGGQLDGVLNTYVVSVIGTLMNAITPVALTVMSLWVLLFGWAVLRGEASDTVPIFVWKVFKIGLVLAFALQSGVYISHVVEVSNALATGIATTFLTSSANPAAIASPYALLDTFNEKASQLVVDLMKDAGITRLDLVFASVVTAFGNVVFLCLALFVITLSKAFLTFILAVGPVFILCLAWRPTARFFDSWLSMVLNAVVLTWFAFFALGLSVFLGERIVQAIDAQGGFLGPEFNVVAESLKYCVVMILMAIVCFQAPGLAASLTGGAAVQQGVQMVQNVMMVSRLGGSSHRAGAQTGIQGGVIRAGTGLPYALGRAAGAASAHAATTRAPSTSMPAYKRAAMRGLT
jgi:type IV secretion system protein VirB6